MAEMLSEYLLRRQGLKNGTREPDPPKAKQPIANRSSKMKEIMKLLKPLYTKFLKMRPFCRIKSPVCSKIATVVHHLKGRTPDLILDEKYFCESCPQCNLYVEEHPDWAMENGFKISKYSN